MKQSIRIRGRMVSLKAFEQLPDEDYRHYSADEEELIRKYWPVKKTRFLADLLGRDVSALNEKAARLGLRKREKHVAVQKVREEDTRKA